MNDSPWKLVTSAVLGCTIAIGVCAAADAAPGAATAPELPPAVAADLKAIANQCTEVGGKPLTDAAVKRVDLNADGADDFVLDVGGVNCDGAASIYGDRAKGVTVYVGDGARGARSAFRDWVYGATIEEAGSASRLWLTVSGEQCGKPPAQDFASENFCERSLVWNAGSGKFEYAPVATVRMIE